MKNFLSNSLIKDGKQYKADGDYPSAITKFTKSIKRNSENLEAYYQLGLIFEEVLLDYDKAISLYKNVISLSERIKPVGTDEELEEFNSLITNTRNSIDRAIETTLPGKAVLYERFADLYPDSRFASDAKDRAVSISYQLAKDENTIDSYSVFLKKYPHNKYSDEAQLKKDKLTFEDQSFLNNINRLKHWIARI